MLKKLFSKSSRKDDQAEAKLAEEHTDKSQGLEDNVEKETPAGLFARLRQGLAKTRAGFVDRIGQVLSGRSIDDQLFDELEEILIQADVGVTTTLELVERIRRRVEAERITEGGVIKELLKTEITELLSRDHQPLRLPEHTPAAFMVVGVNGVGKTTTIGKLAYRFRQNQAKVVLGAADTFRAAAVDQLRVWANRTGADLIAHQEGADPSAVAFDSVAAAKARKAEVLIIDTAGRLHTKTNLMAELGKVYRVAAKELGRELDEVLLVVDATTGQNALSQAKLFSASVPLTGIVLTKLDGTAKGGIILALANELKLPVKLIGVGEQLWDLQDFDPASFTNALFT
ncbi:MAG TPA: signal recognition particle-docking protein FtsY [Limnochordia bacterium]|nr:signal recognition particle-docking protein FtsY [Limnochordia bacterium]HPT92219.1 signal recognition particle-docking protein FtsY [Limnochordia bacterium]HQD70465.1 signal recognition particle-docking protein FtsY [Limnochordia bacterium]HXK97477.1 signal recognition particle-docking protein FtsY [Limnochordia bacterium]